jgi:hypothetical protein
MNRCLLLTGLAVVVLASSFTSAEAQTANVGLRGGFYTDISEAFVGGELLTRVGSSTYFNPNIEYVFTEGLTYLTFNGDFHYDFPTQSAAYFWLGGGLAALYANPEGDGDNSTDVGVNLLAGIGFSRRPVIPYIQGKFVLADNSEFVIGFGLRF